MSLEVLAAGLQTTVQDLGRFGYRHLGVGVAGALDGYSARVANLLVGNPDDSALLEIALHGPRLRFQQHARIAITGADVDAYSDGIAIPGWRPVDLPAACELVIGQCRRGARAYLAIAGGVQVAKVLGSACTDLRAGFGGVDGRCLVMGDVLAFGAALVPNVDEPGIASWWVNPEPDLDFNHSVSIRVLPGHESVALSDALSANPWRVSTQSNRQGLRLQGAALKLADSNERLSEPVAPGTVQLPPDGEPIVLLGEAQTIGGYPRMGHVVSCDLPRLAQLRPGDTLRFEMIDVPAAHALACAQRHRLSRMALAIGQRRHES